MKIKPTKLIIKGGKLTLALLFIHFFCRGWQIGVDYLKAQAAEATEFVTSAAASYGGYVKPSPAMPAPSELGIQDIIEKEAIRAEINVSLFRALAQVESNFNPEAISSASAIGLFQIIPANLHRCGLRSIFELADYRKNARCAAKLFKEDLVNQSYNVERALWAYNGGPKAIKVILDCGERNTECLGGYTESVNHAKLVLAAMAKDIR